MKRLSFGVKKANILILLSLLVLTSLKVAIIASSVDEYPITEQYQIIGKGIVLTQTEARTLSMAEILAKGEYRIIDRSSKLEVPYDDIKMIDIWYSKRKADKISDFSVDGDIGQFTLQIEKDGNIISGEGPAKLVILGDKVRNINENNVNQFPTYVKEDNNKFIFTYNEYLSLKNDLIGYSNDYEIAKRNLALYFHGDDSRLYNNVDKKTQETYNIAINMDEWCYGNGLTIAEEPIGNTEVELERFMNMDKNGGKLILKYRINPYIYGEVDFYPTFEIVILADERKMEEFKQTPPSTRDNSHIELFQVILALSMGIGVFICGYKKTIQY